MAGSSRMPGKPMGSGRQRPSLPAQGSQRGNPPQVAPPPVVAPPPAKTGNTARMKAPPPTVSAPPARTGNTGRMQAPPQVAAPPAKTGNTARMQAPPQVAAPPAKTGNTARMQAPPPAAAPAKTGNTGRMAAAELPASASVKAKPATSRVQPPPAPAPEAKPGGGTRRIVKTEAAPEAPKAKIQTASVKPSVAEAPVAKPAPSARLKAPAPKADAPLTLDEDVKEEVLEGEEEEGKPARKKLGSFKPLQNKALGGVKPSGFEEAPRGKSKLLLILGVIALLLIIGGGIAIGTMTGSNALIPEEGWARESIEEGKLSVLLPKGEPLKTELAVPGYNATEHSILAKAANLTFTLKYARFDDGAPKLEDAATMLTEQILRMPGIKKSAEKPGSLGGQEGKEIEFASGPNTLVVRICATANFYYLLSVEYRGTTRPAEVDKYFTEFKLTE